MEVSLTKNELAILEKEGIYKVKDGRVYEKKEIYKDQNGNRYIKGTYKDQNGRVYNDVIFKRVYTIKDLREKEEIKKKNTELTECLKNEFFLSIDDFGNVSSYDGLPALARLIQRLIIMQPMSYPDEPDMGVGIANYEFEFMDKLTLSEIEEKIKTQIDKYIPNSNINSILVEGIVDEKTNQKSIIGVLINLSTNKNYNSDSMILTFDKVGKRGKIESKIYI